MIVKESKKGDLTFVTISDIGTIHQSLNLPNQDSTAFAEMNGDFVLAVSDGVGSCKYAEKGSKAVVDSCINTFHALKAGILSFDSPKIAQAIWAEWQTLLTEECLDDCGATVQAAFKYGNHIILFSVGDGFSIFSSESKQIASENFEATFLNDTFCLNSSFDSNSFCCKEIPLNENDSFVIVCCTDGFSNGIEANKEIEFVRELETNVTTDTIRTELESFVNAISKISFDDKSVGVVKYGK